MFDLQFDIKIWEFSPLKKRNDQYKFTKEIGNIDKF